MNLAKRYLEMTGQSLEEFDGFCIDLAGDVVENYGGEAIAYQDDPGPWRYHAAPIINGEVHDPHLDDPVDENEWLEIWGGHSLWRSDGE